VTRSWVLRGAGLLLLAALECACGADQWRPELLKSAQVPRTFRVSWANICAPEGFILLVREGQDVVAVRFFGVLQGPQPGTGVAKYAVYDPPPGSAHLGANALIQEGTVSVKGWWGFHPLVFQRGDYMIRVRRFDLEYDFSTCLLLRGTPYEYAPTPWTRIDDVDSGAAFLRWFRERSPSAPSLTISPEELLTPLHRVTQDRKTGPSER